MTHVVPDPLRTRAYCRWSAGAQLSRLPLAMAPLAFTLPTTATTGSHRLGGLMMAVFVAAELVGAVPLGRLFDRVGPGRGLKPALVVAAAGLCGVAAASALGASGPVLTAAVVLPGVVGEGVAGGFRTLLARAVPPAALPRAVALDMIVFECVLVAGPVLASAAALVHPVVPALVMGASCLLSALLVPRGESGGTPRPATGTRLPWRSAAGRPATAYATGHLLSTVEVAPCRSCSGSGPTRRRHPPCRSRCAWRAWSAARSTRGGAWQRARPRARGRSSCWARSRPARSPCRPPRPGPDCSPAPR
ncbi:MFS transporter [Actinosynnema sp. NPDC050436]|uniref:MFS transporter n=1 Tax=Actinosynnema sp. NPDC050436 TaxID=3155659 RepID=UPI0033CE5EDB